jgi:cold shock CspA family protein
LLPVYSGAIDSIRDGLYFIRSGAYPNRILANRSALDDLEVNEIEVGQQVHFRIRFNRVGPVAVEVHLWSSGWRSRKAPLQAVDADRGAPKAVDPSSATAYTVLSQATHLK